MKRLLLLFSLLLSACAMSPSDDISQQMLVHDRRTYDGIVDDKDIATAVKEELNDDETLRGCCHVNINVYNGAVLVTGEATTRLLKDKIIGVIRVIPHVTMVHDHLVVAAPSSKAARSKDTEISNQIRTALEQIQSLPDFDPLYVKVTTSNRIVYLLGRVHREEGKIAINVARLQPHVKQIVALFDYID